jgi:hypothetical protein
VAKELFERSTGTVETTASGPRPCEQLISTAAEGEDEGVPIGTASVCIAENKTRMEEKTAAFCSAKKCK